VYKPDNEACSLSVPTNYSMSTATSMRRLELTVPLPFSPDSLVLVPRIQVLNRMSSSYTQQHEVQTHNMLLSKNRNRKRWTEWTVFV